MVVQRDKLTVELHELQVPLLRRSKSWLHGIKSFPLRIGLLFGLSGLIFVGSAYFLCNFDAIIRSVINTQIVLEKDGSFYELWREPPLPFVFRVHLFNVTNADEFPWTSTKPRLTQLGPYAFREKWNRTNIRWYDNGTLSYTKMRTFTFDPSQSNGSLDDLVTNFNLPLIAAADRLKSANAMLRFIAAPVLRMMKESLFVHKPVRELLFDGYDNPILKVAKNFMHNIPYDRFGYLYGRNESVEERFTIDTGAGGRISNVGNTQNFNEQNETKVWTGPLCNAIGGTDGSSFPPIVDQSSDLQIYHPFLCRSFNLSFARETDYHGVHVYKYELAAKNFFSGDLFTENKCFCHPDYCLKSGVLYVGPCYYGLPMYTSMPNFYQADDSFLQAIDGPRPDKPLHSSYVLVEPLTGVPLSVTAKLQLNVLLEPIPKMGMFQSMPNMLFPLLWSEEAADVSEDMVKEFSHHLFVPMLTVKVATYLLLVFGLVAFVSSPILYIKYSYGYSKTKSIN